MADVISVDELDFAGLIKPGDVVVCGQASRIKIGYRPSQ